MLIVMPSKSVLRIWSAPLPTPAMSRMSFSRTPCQRAAPTYLPPTLLETHVRVMSRSTIGMSSSSSKLIWSSFSTSPSTVSVQPFESTIGVSPGGRVSTR